MRPLLGIIGVSIGLGVPGGARQVGEPSAALRSRFELSSHYEKVVDVGGFPVVASAKVDDHALLEAAYWIDLMLRDRDDVRRALIGDKVRFAVMAIDEFTTDLPEHADLEPKAYWDKRARGLGSTPERPCVSCGEENLLRYPGDPYLTESILIHEFAHAMHLQGLNLVDRGFDDRLKACYEAAMKGGLWAGKYAASNKEEYWAEGVQSYFDTNRESDHDHNHVDTRDELRAYDRQLHDLIDETFRRPSWRYVDPRERPGEGHLAGYEPERAPTFRWPEAVIKAFAEHQAEERDLPEVQALPLSDLSGARSPRAGAGTRLLIENRTERPLRLYWIDFAGERKPYGWIRKGGHVEQQTFEGHLFLVTNAEGEAAALFAAAVKPSRAIVR